METIDIGKISNDFELSHFTPITCEFRRMKNLAIHSEIIDEVSNVDSNLNAAFEITVIGLKLFEYSDLCKLLWKLDSLNRVFLIDNYIL